MIHNLNSPQRIFTVNNNNSISNKQSVKQYLTYFSQITPSNSTTVNTASEHSQMFCVGINEAVNS